MKVDLNAKQVISMKNKLTDCFGKLGSKTLTSIILELWYVGIPRTVEILVSSDSSFDRIT